jgi:hypothetical protein
LFALSDAARYVGDLSLAGETLMTIRRRSPQHADKAAFFLGRLEEIRGRPQLALKWYSLVGESDDSYTAEARVAKHRIESNSGRTRPQFTP